MFKLRCCKKLSFRIQIFQHFRICFLYKKSGKWRLCAHLTFLCNKLYKWKIVVSSNIGIVLTKGRSDMHDTGTIGHGYISITSHEETFLVLFVCALFGTSIQWLILLALQIASLISLKHLISRCITVFICQAS